MSLILICPYCGSELEETWSSCCGEAGHGELVEEDEDEQI